jgi:hypothetical protein
VSRIVVRAGVSRHGLHVLWLAGIYLLKHFQK